MLKRSLSSSSSPMMEGPMLKCQRGIDAMFESCGSATKEVEEKEEEDRVMEEVDGTDRAASTESGP